MLVQHEMSQFVSGIQPTSLRRGFYGYTPESS
jgi:hypothetical protein